MTNLEVDTEARRRTVRRSVIAWSLVAFLPVTFLCCCGVAWVLDLGSGSCGLDRPSGITTKDLVGTYRASDGGVLTLSTGGAVTAIDVQDPNLLFLPPGQVAEPYTSSGTWNLLSGKHQLSGIEFRFILAPEEMAPTEFYLVANLGGSRSRPVVYWDTNDPDECAAYRLKQA